MSRSPQKIWFAIVLMLMQLVINGTALAMPMPDASTAEPPAETMSDCAEHSMRHHPVEDSDVASSDEMRQGDSIEDCCKQGGCGCPCLHGSAAALAIQECMHPAFAELRMLAVVGVLPHGRPNSLFRPPA